MIVAEVGSRSPKTTTASFTTTNSWLHSCQKGKKCMNGPFSHDFLSSSSGSDINDLFEGKATLKYFKWAEETSSTYATQCTVLWSAFVIENPTTSISGGARNTVAWKEIVSRTATFFSLQSFMNLACAVQSVKFLVLIGYFSSTLMHHTTAWTWYANWVQYVPAFILSQLGVWLMAMNLSSLASNILEKLEISNFKLFMKIWSGSGLVNTPLLNCQSTDGIWSS